MTRIYLSKFTTAMGRSTFFFFFFFFPFLFIAIQMTLLTKQDKNTDNTTNNTTKIRYVNYLVHGTSLQYTTFTFFFITHLANNNPKSDYVFGQT